MTNLVNDVNKVKVIESGTVSSKIEFISLYYGAGHVSILSDGVHISYINSVIELRELVLSFEMIQSNNLQDIINLIDEAV